MSAKNNKPYKFYSNKYIASTYYITDSENRPLYFKSKNTHGSWIKSMTGMYSVDNYRFMYNLTEEELFLELL